VSASSAPTSASDFSTLATARYAGETAHRIDRVVTAADAVARLTP
jgi:hypothetical protein